MLLRTTALVDVPARIVSAALTEFGGVLVAPATSSRSPACACGRRPRRWPG